MFTCVCMVLISYSIFLLQQFIVHTELTSVSFFFINVCVRGLMMTSTCDPVMVGDQFTEHKLS